MAKAKEIAGLDCGASAAIGIRLVLLSRLEEMCEYRAAALDWSDPEGVHDMRVASRRLRSLLRDFSPYLRRRQFRNVRKDLKAVADALGRVRDEDVAIMALEKLAAEAPPEMAEGVEGFANKRRMRRERVRVRLEKMLTESALDELRGDFRVALEEGVKENRKGVADKEKLAGGATFRRAGRDIILSRMEELRELSGSLYRPFRVRPLHRMRIAAKRLRYAVELFAPCWNEPLEPFAKEIARLQTSLGELHDCDEWIAETGASLLAQTEARRYGALVEDSGAHKLNAVVWLLNHFVKERTRHFGDALARWHEWETTGFQSRLASILDSELPVESALSEEDEDTEIQKKV